MNLLIKGGTIVNPKKQQHEVADILVKDGKIAEIGQNLSADGAEVYDATGLVVTPGLIDMHTHLREPGQEDICLSIISVLSSVKTVLLYLSCDIL